VKYSFKELVDVPRLQELADEIHAATGIPSAIITMDGEVLTGSGWQRICTQFHRAHPVIGQECIASDVAIRKALDTGEPYVMYRCPRGLVDASSPVILEGEHIANVFVGQFFTEPPDERTELFFREQARRFGLDEEAYVAAYREIPVLAEAKFRAALSFLAKLARVIAGIGLARLRELAAADGLRASEARFRAIFNDSPIAIFEEDFSGVRAGLDGLHAAGVSDLRAFLDSHPGEVQRLAGLVRILDVNEASVRTLEARSREELLGGMRRPFSEGAQQSFKAELVALDSGRTKFAGEFPAVSRTGRPMWLALTLAVQPGSESTLARVLVSFVDITERKQAVEALRESEERYRSILNASPDVITITDLAGRITMASPVALAMFGGEREDEPVGHLITDYIVPEDRERAAANVALMNRGVLTGPAEYRGLRAGRGAFDMEVNGESIRGADGQPASMVFVVRDITERKRAVEALRDLNATLEARVAERTAQLEAANREMESFTYSVSHDLRAPLRAIDGYGKAFAEDYGAALAPAARDALSAIRGSTRQMSQLVDGLLGLSRLGRQRLHVETIATADIVRAALADAGARERQGLVDIVVGELPPCRADGTLLRQVFVNLFQNAFKFAAGREDARVEVGCRDEGGAAVFYVRDNGVGFDMQYAGKLFQPFQRLHSKTEFAGNGVGLAIVHRIVERHGGRVWVESAPGRGATFFFTIGEVAPGE
jgi:PAS domain S-box-containing protein